LLTDFRYFKSCLKNGNCTLKLFELAQPET
jgi:hypothetical protein